MEFEEKKRIPNNSKKYHLENIRLARKFTKSLLDELNDLVRSVVIFGSNVTNTLTKDSDIDIMVVLDNVSVFVTPELREAYKIICDKITSELSDKFHILTVNLSDYWDMARKGDPVLLNILRSGMPIFDRDLVEPMQYLLEIGKVRPSFESIYTYKSRGITLLEESSFHLSEAIMDLYYAAIDTTHAFLMVKGELPPSPREMPSLLKKHLTKKKDKFIIDGIFEIQKISKEIEHSKNSKFSGKDYDNLRKKISKIINSINLMIEDEISKKDIFDL